MPETNNDGYIIAAYVVTWVVLVAYTVRLVQGARRAARELARAQREEGRES